MEHGVTLFQGDPNQPRAAIVAGIVETISEHHNEWEHPVAMTVLEIYGADRTPELLQAVARIGLSEITWQDEHLECVASHTD